MWEWIIVAVAVPAACFYLYSLMAPFRRIWRGDAAAAASVPTRDGPLQARNYLAYLLMTVPPATGMLVLSGALLATKAGVAVPLMVFKVFVGLLGSVFPFGLVAAFVWALNRPRWLVPPPYRGLPGAIGAWRSRQARRNVGLPPTTHLVELIVLPGGDDTDLMAWCSAEGCDWTVYPDQLADDAEADLRMQAAEHSGRVAPGIVRVD